jgi:hypothetical protein
MTKEGYGTQGYSQQGILFSAATQTRTSSFNIVLETKLSNDCVQWQHEDLRRFAGS